MVLALQTNHDWVGDVVNILLPVFTTQDLFLVSTLEWVSLRVQAHFSNPPQNENEYMTSGSVQAC